MKICVRAECRPVAHALDEGRARGEREDLREEVPQRAGDRDRPVGAADGHVHVQPEGVVTPDDVAEELVVSAVVRRVDDALLLPVRPRVGPGGAEEETHRLDERLKLRAPLRHGRGHVRERLLPARADLDLGGDELADEVLGERRLRGCRLDLLEAVRQIERLRVDERELLLDGRREVGRVLELLARERDLLVGRKPLLVAHGGTNLDEVLSAP